VSLGALLSGPAGPYIAILAMTAATYLCRASGVVLMSRIRITPRVERGLRALPGSIVVSTVLPLGMQGGPAALAGLAVATSSRRSSAVSEPSACCGRLVFSVPLQP
jgi:uncharacterized membrane protein